VVNRKVCGGNRGWYRAETERTLMTLFRTAYHQGVDAIGIMIVPAPITRTNSRSARNAPYRQARPISTCPICLNQALSKYGF
jgi:hypothetical protein